MWLNRSLRVIIATEHGHMSREPEKGKFYPSKLKRIACSFREDLEKENGI